MYKKYKDISAQYCQMPIAFEQNFIDYLIDEENQKLKDFCQSLLEQFLTSKDVATIAAEPEKSEFKDFSQNKLDSQDYRTCLEQIYNLKFFYFPKIVGIVNENASNIAPATKKFNSFYHNAITSYLLNYLIKQTREGKGNDGMATIISDPKNLTLFKQICKKLNRSNKDFFQELVSSPPHFFTPGSINMLKILGGLGLFVYMFLTLLVLIAKGSERLWTLDSQAQVLLPALSLVFIWFLTELITRGPSFYREFKQYKPQFEQFKAEKLGFKSTQIKKSIDVHYKFWKNPAEQKIQPASGQVTLQIEAKKSV